MAQRARKTAGAAAGALPFFTLLAGDDTVSRERARTQLLDRIRAARGEITVEIFDSEQQTVAGLTERVLTPSLFGGVRVFVVPHAESLDTEELAELEQLLGASLTDEYVVVEGDKPGEDHKALAGFVRKAEKRAKEAAGACQVVTLLKPPPWKTADWLVANTPVLFGRRIDRADAEYLVERAGDDYDMLRSELEKIDLYLDEGKPVTREAIAGIVEGTREAAAYELAQALGRKEIGRALGLLDSLFSSSFYPPACISAIYRHFWSLLRIRAFEQKEPEKVRAFMRAVQGRDREGITALVNSLSRLPHDLAAGSSAAILEVHPSLLEGDGRAAFVDLVQTAIRQGVGQMQFNVVSAEMLRGAQADPDRYRNLCVRVSGFSQQFVLLGRDMQDHIIARTKHRS